MLFTPRIIGSFLGLIYDQRNLRVYHSGYINICVTAFYAIIIITNLTTILFLIQASRLYIIRNFFNLKTDITKYLKKYHKMCMSLLILLLLSQILKFEQSK